MRVITFKGANPVVLVRSNAPELCASIAVCRDFIQYFSALPGFPLDTGLSHRPFQRESTGSTPHHHSKIEPGREC